MKEKGIINEIEVALNLVNFESPILGVESVLQEGNILEVNFLESLSLFLPKISHLAQPTDQDFESYENARAYTYEGFVDDLVAAIFRLASKIPNGEHVSVGTILGVNAQQALGLLNSEGLDKPTFVSSIRGFDNVDRPEGISEELSSVVIYLTENDSDVVVPIVAVQLLEQTRTDKFAKKVGRKISLVCKDNAIANILRQIILAK